MDPLSRRFSPNLSCTGHVNYSGLALRGSTILAPPPLLSGRPSQACGFPTPGGAFAVVEGEVLGQPEQQLGQAGIALDVLRPHT